MELGLLVRTTYAAAMHGATFRLDPGGPYGAPTLATGATVELWCNDHCDLLDVRNDPDGRVVAAIEDRVGLRDRLVDDGRTVAITETCLKDERPTIEAFLQAHDCLLVPPLRYAEGAKFCRVLALDPADLTALYRDLVDEWTVTVEAKREIDTWSVEHPLVTLESVLPSLSDRQRETLLLAYERGYYEIPRRTTTADLAAELGVERRTAEDHLRRAENKLVDALAEHVESASWPGAD
jgi:predicted DNA binding protein